MSLVQPTAAFGLAALAGTVAKATGCAFVIVEVDLHHGVEATLAAFPSIDHAEIELLDGPQALRFDDDASAQEAFTRISRDMAAAHAALPGSVEATVTYVGRLDAGRGDGSSIMISTSNAAGADQPLHVFVEGRMLNEPLPAPETRS